MDEQTAQGSTALMLACKRGHEKCAELLVSMGAENYMRDKRSRTAKDTATRRNHIGLLSWLDTQVQVRKVQESRHQYRSALIINIRKAFLRRKLSLSVIDQGIMDIYKAVHRTEIGQSTNQDVELISQFMIQSKDLAFTAKNPGDTLLAIKSAIGCKVTYLSIIFLHAK
jgi:hypothetical protein